MIYKTTQIQPIRSYPTYQFHAYSSPVSKCSPDITFRICVLEVLKWLRNRFRQFEDLPQEIIAPEPADYGDYSEDEMCSFNINIGAALDCT